jgi:competence protein ComEC
MPKDYKNLGERKKRKIVRRLFVIFGAATFLLLIIPLINIYIFKPGRLEVDYLNIGQGDSELIRTPNHKLVLIDGGPDNLVLNRLGEVLPFYQKRIDYIILSHYHDDHATGLLEVIKRYQVKNLIYSNKRQSELLANLLKVAQDNKVRITALSNSAQIDLEKDCFINVLNPESLKIPDDQNNSLVTKLDCDKNSFLFAGDNSLVVERYLLKSNFDLKADVLKASHHGSKTANSDAFLKAVGPTDFVISDGLNNKFNHPSPEIVSRAQGLGLKIFRTDKQGTIRIFRVFH